jgi:hypothetical protein
MRFIFGGLICAGLLGGACFLGMHWFLATDISMCTDTVIADCQYPNGDTVATWFEREGGATVAGTTTFLLLHDASEPLQWNDTEIVFRHSSDPREENDVIFLGEQVKSILWVSNKKLIVKYAGDAWKKSASWQGKQIQFVPG